MNSLGLLNPYHNLQVKADCYCSLCAKFVLDVHRTVKSIWSLKAMKMENTNIQSCLWYINLSRCNHSGGLSLHNLFASGVIFRGATTLVVWAWTRQMFMYRLWTMCSMNGVTKNQTDILWYIESGMRVQYTYWYIFYEF